VGADDTAILLLLLPLYLCRCCEQGWAAVLSVLPVAAAVSGS
jgi:hypothetical protein